jgi:CDP-diacylglycerol--glycerol-3-phosphate 3-phosphatidyltransferase
MEQGHVIGASWWGKAKTVAQVIMVLCLITVDGSPAWVDAIVYATVVVTVLSGADYFFGLHRILARAREAAAEGGHGHGGPGAQAWPSSQARMDTRSSEGSPVASSPRRSPSSP